MPRRSRGKSLKRSPAEVRLAELVRLDHRAHGAVEHENAFGGGRAEQGGGVGFGDGGWQSVFIGHDHANSKEGSSCADLIRASRNVGWRRHS